jgi:hypothetical protein
MGSRTAMARTSDGSKPQSDGGGGEQAKSGGSTTPVWRASFDAFERPIATASESWLNSDAFMDGLSVAWRLRRRMSTELRRGLGLWAGVLNVSSRSDIDRLSNQLARLERQVRELRKELEPAADRGAAPRQRTSGGQSRRTNSGQSRRTNSGQSGQRNGRG